MKKFLSIVFVLFLSTFVTAIFAVDKDKKDSVVAAGPVVSVLDFNKVLLSYPQLETAKAELKNKFDPRSKEIEVAQKKFQTDVQAFSKNVPTMKPDEKKSAEQKLQNDQKKLQDMQTKFQNDLTTSQNEAMQKIIKKVEAIVTKIAENKNIDIVISKSGVAYNKPSLDITDEVIKQMKKK